MIQMTIKEALMNENESIPGWVYVIREGDVIFYVGISQNPIFRLCQHVGIAESHAMISPCEVLVKRMGNGDDISNMLSSSVGQCILDNVPKSLEWSFDIYEKEDAIAVIKRADLHQVFPRILEMMEVNWYEQRTIVEDVLIKELKPCLNRMGKRDSNPLPERYIKRKIANEGVKLKT